MCFCGYERALPGFIRWGEYCLFQFNLAWPRPSVLHWDCVEVLDSWSSVFIFFSCLCFSLFLFDPPRRESGWAQITCHVPDGRTDNTQCAFFSGMSAEFYLLFYFIHSSSLSHQDKTLYFSISASHWYIHMSPCFKGYIALWPGVISTSHDVFRTSLYIRRLEDGGVIGWKTF